MAQTWPPGKTPFHGSCLVASLANKTLKTPRCCFQMYPPTSPNDFLSAPIPEELSRQTAVEGPPHIFLFSEVGVVCAGKVFEPFRRRRPPRRGDPCSLFFFVLAMHEGNSGAYWLVTTRATGFFHAGLVTQRLNLPK